MVQEDVQQWTKKQPFVPFELITSAGERHVVLHPEFAVVSSTAMAILDPTTDRISYVALMHVTEIRPVETASSDA